MCILSIVIPTKNRYEYLTLVLESIIKLNLNQTEIIIQDNSDDNEGFLIYLNRLNNTSIKYFYEQGQLSQTQNSDLAVSHATAKYICYIGDDDTVTSILPKICFIMSKYKIDAINFSLIDYDWPDLNLYDSVKKKRPPLYVELKKIKVKQINTKKILKFYLNHGMQSNTLLPKAYHGIISREILEIIKEKSGSYFPGPSPDMDNAVAAACIVDRHYYIQYPMIISGVGYKSANGMGRRGVHKGNIKDAKQLAPDVEKKWNQYIPKLWIGQTIWPESCIKALMSMQEFDLLKKMNFCAMYGRIYLCWPEYRKQLKQYIKSSKMMIIILFNIIYDIIIWIIKNNLKEIRLIIGFDYYTNEKLSIISANEKVKELLKNKYGSDEFVIQLIENQIAEKQRKY